MNTVLKVSKLRDRGDKQLRNFFYAWKIQEWRRRNLSRTGR